MSSSLERGFKRKGLLRSRALKLVAFWCAYAMFGGVGFLTSVGSFVISAGCDSARTRRFGQLLIHKLFRFFVWYNTYFGLLELRLEGFESLRRRRNVILAANHPSLLDAVFIAAQVPNLFCLMKSSLVHNVVLCGQAKLAGYVNNRSGAGLVKMCKKRIGEGSLLLVFPEGTRTTEQLGSFKMGFALLAKACRTPIQTVIIRYDTPFLGKGWPFFRAPEFPVTCELELGKLFHPDLARDARELGGLVETYLNTLDLQSRPETTVA